MDGSHYDWRSELKKSPAPAVKQVWREVLLTLAMVALALAATLAIDAMRHGARSPFVAIQEFTQ